MVNIKSNPIGMGLFQQSVLNKYLHEADQTQMEAAYQRLKDYIHNPVIQQNIRESKEEQFQEGFLTELFVKVLGYIINPNPDYNLTTDLWEQLQNTLHYIKNNRKKHQLPENKALQKI